MCRQNRRAFPSDIEDWRKKRKPESIIQPIKPHHE
jgi:hypothetical protein